jgi:hypothetical protein
MGFRLLIIIIKFKIIIFRFFQNFYYLKKSFDLKFSFSFILNLKFKIKNY